MIHSNNNNNNIFLTELENNMFTIKNISKIPEFIVNATDSRQSRQSNNRNNVINAANNIFYPKQRDQLFWIFYTILHSVSEYEMTHNFFTTEKEIKYKWIEDFRAKKEIFKPIKVSRNTVEDELANKPKISLCSIKALCYLHDVNIFYIDNKKFFIEFEDGEAKVPLKAIGKSKQSGTKITFLPSTEIFSSIKFSANIFKARVLNFST